MPQMDKATTKQEFVEAIQSYIESDAFQQATFEEGWDRLFLKYRRRQLLRDSGREKDILKDQKGTEFYQAFKYSVTDPSPDSKDAMDIVYPNKLEYCRQIDWTWMQNPDRSLQDNNWLDTWNMA